MDKKQMNEVLNWVGRRGISLISLLAGLMSAVSLTYGAYALYDTMYIEQTAEAPLLNKPEIIEDGETPLAGFGELQDINPDVGAWLTVYNTKIDYPVTQGKVFRFLQPGLRTSHGQWCHVRRAGVFYGGCVFCISFVRCSDHPCGGV